MSVDKNPAKIAGMFDAIAQIDGAPDGLDVGVTIVEVEVHQ